MRKLTPKQLREQARKRFLKARSAEGAYVRELSSVGREIGKLIRGFAPKGEAKDLAGLNDALRKYSELIRPWARHVTNSMHARVGKQDARSWAELGEEMGRALRHEILTAPTGKAMREILNAQVDLITSLPREAAERVHKLTVEAQMKSERAAEVAKEIMQSGHVSVSRARLIARTEVARTSSVLTQARAQHVGSEGYIWRTAMDSDVRPDHRRLEGKFIKWDEPPISDRRSGTRAHAGCLWNCRCYPEPLIP